MPVTLFGDKVLIIPDALEEKTKGGLFIPETAKDSQTKVMATVYAHGNGIVDESTGILQPIKVKNGDRVSLSKEVAYSMPLGEDVTGIRNTLYLINESDIDFILK